MEGGCQQLSQSAKCLQPVPISYNAEEQRYFFLKRSRVCLSILEVRDKVRCEPRSWGRSPSTGNAAPLQHPLSQPDGLERSARLLWSYAVMITQNLRGRITGQRRSSAYHRRVVFYATVPWWFFVTLCRWHATVRFSLPSTIRDLASATLCLYPASYRNCAARINLCALANKLSATRKSRISCKECTVMFGSRVVQRNAILVNDRIFAVYERYIITLYS